MTRKPNMLLVCALVAGAALGACGGSGAPSRTTASTTTAVTTAPAAAATTTSSTSTTTGTSISGSTSSSSTSATTSSATAPATPAAPLQSLAAAAAVCRQEVASLTSTALTPGEHAQLTHLCNVAGSLGRARLLVAERQICLTVIHDTAPGLSGAALAAAEASCQRF